MRSRLLQTALWLIGLQLAFADPTAVPSQRQPMVKIQSGLLQGIPFGSNPNAAAFLGIPYAAPPVGALRWKPPQPPHGWTETRPAATYGSPCSQLPAPWFEYIKGNEDCLYLNVWTPDLRDHANRPVLVYFHGGSNTQGYSQMTPLGPTFTRQGLVVVSANYRLGPFGFLALPALTSESEHHSSGNYGLLDQIEALKWIKQNIRQFGGDPTRITVMGQSAGAVDVCLLMASPLADGLFQRAILESGECQATLNEDIRASISYNFVDSTGEASGQRLMRDLGVTAGRDSLSALRQIPSDEILKAWKTDPGLHFDAIVDDWVVPRQPAQIFAEGKQMRIPILVGSNSDEATVFGHNSMKTMADYRQYLQKDTGAHSDEEFQLYPVRSDAEVPSRAIQLESDEFASGAYSMAQAMTKAGARSYLYYFRYADPGKRSRLGAHHGEELFFLSDSYPTAWEHTAQSRRIGELMRGYWAQFAKTGDPNFNAAPNWPPYANKSPECFEIGEHIGPQPVSDRIRGLENTLRRVVAEEVGHEATAR